jgi:hypothetical protein
MFASPRFSADSSVSVPKICHAIAGGLHSCAQAEAVSDGACVIQFKGIRMKKIAYAVFATGAALALAACGSSDNASEDASAENVEMPAEEAMTSADATAAPADAATDAAAAASDSAAAASDAAAAASGAAEAATTEAEKKM